MVIRVKLILYFLSTGSVLVFSHQAILIFPSIEMGQLIVGAPINKITC